ncbi:MAG: HDIG domain-containing protein [Parcubacteria group bacterium]|nr:HDIG domain-containing protein [Parcubacteria group bacterium]
MQRTGALDLLHQKIKTVNLIKHSLAVEAGMRALAQYFHENEDDWGLAGLLHDIDYEDTKDNPQEHSLKGAEFLKSLGLADDITEAIKTHNQAHGIKPETTMAKSLFCIDPLTGLIVAATLVLPSKKIHDLTVENILNRMKEKSFAQGANRETIKQCETLLNLPLEQFCSLVLKGMQNISQELGL